MFIMNFVDTDKSARQIVPLCFTEFRADRLKIRNEALNVLTNF